MSKIIFHIPHDGIDTPAELMQSICISEKDFYFYQEKMQDIDVQRFVPLGYDSVCFAVSRLLCDVERFVDGNEPMEKYGMGFCYERVYDGTIIKTVNPTLKEDTMKYYQRHHHLLNQLATSATPDNRLFIIDLHSFSEEQVVAFTKNTHYSDICLGYDTDFCDTALVDDVASLCRSFGFSVSINFPYSGSIVPNAALLDRSLQCNSLMVEFNKRIYRHSGKTDNKAAKRLQDLLSKIALIVNQYTVLKEKNYATIL